MTTYYVSSVDGDNGDAGTSWADAKATVAGALAVATTTGDVILVDSAHSYTAGSSTNNDWQPSANIVVQVISVNRGTGAHEAGASEGITTLANANRIAPGNVNSGLYIEGMTFVGQTKTAIGIAAAQVHYKGCTFTRTSGSYEGDYISHHVGGAGAYYGPTVRFENCTFTVTNSGYLHRILSFTGPPRVEITGCSFTFTKGSGFDPQALFYFDLFQGEVRVVGCDLSGYNPSTGPLVAIASGCTGGVEFVNCNLPGTPSHVITFGSFDGFAASLVNSDDADTTYEYERRTREGTLTVDTATYASDGATVDAQALSWKIVTTSAADEDSPFVTPWVSTWIDSTGSKTLSLELVYDNASNYDDREIWAEIEYLGNASYPLGTAYSSRNANPFTGTGTDLTAGSATWTEALTNDNKDKITTTVDVNGKGLARARLYVAVASTTIYLDPQLRVA